MSAAVFYIDDSVFTFLCFILLCILLGVFEVYHGLAWVFLVLTAPGDCWNV